MVQRLNLRTFTYRCVGLAGALAAITAISCREAPQRQVPPAKAKIPAELQLAYPSHHTGPALLENGGRRHGWGVISSEIITLGVIGRDVYGTRRDRDRKTWGFYTKVESGIANSEVPLTELDSILEQKLDVRQRRDEPIEAYSNQAVHPYRR